LNAGGKVIKKDLGNAYPFKDWESCNTLNKRYLLKEKKRKFGTQVNHGGKGFLEERGTPAELPQKRWPSENEETGREPIRQVSLRKTEGKKKSASWKPFKYLVALQVLARDNNKKGINLHLCGGNSETT